MARVREGSNWTLICWTASTLSAALMFCLVVQPFNDDQYGKAPFSAANVVVAVMCAGLAASILIVIWGESHRTRRGLVTTALVLPIACLIWAATLIDDHRTQTREIRAFETYTRHFPPGALAGPGFQTRQGRFATVCASQPERAPLTEFCLDIVLSKVNHGFHVDGGYRWHPDEDDPDLDVPQAVFDCFGETVACAG